MSQTSWKQFNNNNKYETAETSLEKSFLSCDCTFIYFFNEFNVIFIQYLMHVEAIESICLHSKPKF